MNDSNRTRKSDLIASLVLSLVCGGIFGAMMAQMFDATVPWLLIAALSGSVAMVALSSILIRASNGYIRGLTNLSETFFNVTDAPTAPESTSEAIAQANHEQHPVLRTIAIWEGLQIGALIGAALAFVWATANGSNHHLAYVTAGAILGAAIGAYIRWRWIGASFALEVMLFRSLGLTAGYGVIGGVVGVMFGMSLWHKWQGRWSVTVALIVALPFAILFAVLGFQRSRRYRQANHD